METELKEACVTDLGRNRYQTWFMELTNADYCANDYIANMEKYG